MAVWLTAFGAMLIPLAFILRLAEGKPSFELYVFLIIGFLSMGMGWVSAWREMKQNRKERRLFAELLVSIQSVLNDILEELRGDEESKKKSK